MKSPPTRTAGIRELVRGENAFVGQLTLKAGAQVPLHQDATEEYLYVLEGQGTLTIDGVEYQISPHTTIYMPANAEVAFTNSNTPFTAIQVFAGPQSADKYQKWSQ